MRKSVTAALGVLSGASVAFAAATVFQLSGKSTLEMKKTENGTQISKVETTFVEDNYGATPQIFKVITKSDWNTSVDGQRARTYVEAYSAEESHVGVKSWTSKFKGGDFKVFNEEFAMTTEWGCCDSPNMNYMINLANGKVTVTTLNESTVELFVPNSKLNPRYLAQVDDPKAPAKKGDRSLIGTVGYFDAKKLKGIARVYAALPPSWGASFDSLTPVLNKRDEHRNAKVTVWSADGSADAKKAFSGLGLQGKISYENKEASFSVVVDGDRLSEVRSQGTSDLSIDVINLD